MPPPTNPNPPPPLPNVGDLDWGTQLNDSVVWLYEQMMTNQNRIAALELHCAALMQENTAMADQIADLEAKPEYVYNSYSWQYSNQAPPPTGSQVRFDNADLSLATVMIARLIDNDGADRTPVFQKLDAGCKVSISDWDDGSKTHQFSVTGPAEIAASDVAVPIVWDSGNGTIPNAKANVAFLVALNL